MYQSAELDEAIITARRVGSRSSRAAGRSLASPSGYEDAGIGREFAIEGAIEGFTQTKRINVKLTV
ncbi:hypothetical protein ACFP51_34025 [Streptomyces pratens]|uniref:Uncharacterized protein n=1 Tax=Streptomyces pratens TaxID=887456 RepID=A0ABW1LRL2_9ACTN